jgi:tetratricopeptide (TPR) repeat protein
MAGRHGSGVAAVLSLALFPLATRPAQAQASGWYSQLVERYRSGDAHAASDLVWMLSSGAPWGGPQCATPAQCRAAAVLDLEASARLCAEGRTADAATLTEETLPLVERRRDELAFDWLLAAGHLLQAHGDHGRAYPLYARALRLEPKDPAALLAQATALEFSVLPDGFGGTPVSAEEVAEVLLPGRGRERSPNLAYELANPKSESPARRDLLGLLTRRYRDLLGIDPTRTEARLRLGRVLLARGYTAEGEAELRVVARATTDVFCAALARLCLARLEKQPGRAASAYESAVEIDPLLPQAWLGLSRVRRAMGDRAGARGALERVLALGGSPTVDAWVEYHFGGGRSFPAALEKLRADVVTQR